MESNLVQLVSHTIENEFIFSIEYFTCVCVCSEQNDGTMIIINNNNDDDDVNNNKISWPI